jgi:hypothetical protein
VSYQVYLALRVLHLASMAVWFGGALSAPSDIRRTLASSSPDLASLAERLGRAVRLSQVAGVLVAASGLAMVFQGGGFAALPPRIHAGLGITLLAIAVEFVLLGPIVKAFRPESTVSADARDAARRRFAAVSGGLHLARLVVLVLMVWRG